MKIAVYSNAPHAPTGYGQQTAQLTKRLAADGHDVAILANYGLMGAPQVYEGVKVLPGGMTAYSTDIVDFQTKLHFEGQKGLVLSLYDVWPLLESGHDPFKDFDAAFWTPVDHMPVPPKVADWARTHDTISMAKFGHEMFTRVGVETTYIPHAIETSVYRPVGRDFRSTLRVPEDAHLTVIVMANIGVWPPRKAWAQNLAAWQMFSERHDDAYLYIHTQLQHPRGLDLTRAIIRWSLPQERIRIVDQGAYASGLVSQTDLARIYSAGDVLLMATMGEGFGIPSIEAQACGLPVIVTDFSAQPELVGAGWKVKWEPDWDYAQDAFLARPTTASILDALEQSYAASKDPAVSAEMSGAAVKKAQEYDADKVYAEYWRPYIAKWQERLNQAPRKGMTNAAKRRAKKEAKKAA